MEGNHENRYVQDLFSNCGHRIDLICLFLWVKWGRRGRERSFRNSTHTDERLCCFGS